MRLSGSITALATPFTATGEVDLAAWARLLQAQQAGGIDGVVVAGSTGEATALDDGELTAIVTAALQTFGGKQPVLVGTGHSNTLKTIEATRRAAALGADAALIVTPPYVRPTQQGLIAHYTAIADDGALPIVLYNVPGRTACDMLPDTVAALAGHPRIIGVKEARADAERMAALLPLRREDFAILSGDDPTCLRAMQAGADGVISVGSNVVPGAFARLARLAKAGDAPAAAALDAQLQPLYDFLAIEPNPIPLKALLAALGAGVAPRLPLTPLSSAHAALCDAMHALVTAIEPDSRLLRAA